jgi:hypothetical protein
MPSRKEMDYYGQKEDPTAAGGGYKTPARADVPASVVPTVNPGAWLGQGGFSVPMVGAPPGADTTYYAPFYGMGQTTPSMVGEFGPQSGKVFENLGVLLEDPTAQRESMRAQTAARSGEAMANFQRHAARGGAALRGGATGAAAAQVARGIHYPGEIQAEAAYLEAQQRNVVSLSQAMDSTIARAMEYNEYDDSRKIVAKGIVDEALKKMGENINDEEFTPTLQKAFKQYWLDIANGMDPIVAALKFDSVLTSGMTGFGAQTASGAQSPDEGYEPELTSTGSGVI